MKKLPKQVKYEYKYTYILKMDKNNEICRYEFGKCK